jgi:glutamyl-tRNA(Gln) amidotransferase subunit D
VYSDAVTAKLESAGAEVGDLVRSEGLEGRVMPKPDSGDPDVLVLKLDSGYNIGVRPDEIELVEKTESSMRDLEAPEYDEGKDDILVLHTGGTIASRVSYEEGGVEPAFEPEEILDMYPEAAEEVNIHSEVVAQMYSGDMEPGHWQRVARRIHEVKDDYDGILVGHGTDTMAYTGSALSLMLSGIGTGVVLVGAQRSSDRPSSDSSMNLFCAAKFLSETGYTGIGLCMHRGIEDTECVVLPAAKARKMHTSRRDTFEAINSEPVGVVNYDTGEVEAELQQRNNEYRFRPDLEEDVRIVKSRPGFKLDELDFLLEKEPDGIVIEGTGLGHAPVNAFDDLTQHHEQILDRIDRLSDICPVVVASQCIHGRVNMNVYQYGLKIQEAGGIGAKDMHPELAYVKLMWSLANSDSREDAEHLFLKNVNGEITDRELP